jgi:adenosylhomocysteine nucleosidase
MGGGPIGFVVGLTAEARLPRGGGFMVGVGGGTPAGAAAAAQALLAQGAAGLVSFGLAGGLDPALPPGAILVPGQVVEGEASFACDPALIAWLGGATAAAMLAGANIAATAAQKSALFAATRAAGIDLESGAVARVAAAAGIPFAVLRAVADPAARTLPPAASAALDAAGKINMSAVLASLLRHPGQLPALLALAGDAARARAALAAKLRRLNP